MIGKTISHYKIIEKLGQGGMGVVYVAQDLKLDRKVALKFLPPSYSSDEDAKKRFIHEAKAISSLQHHNICSVHEINETEEGQLFICMDLYEGETLKQKIEKDFLDIDTVNNIASQIAEGLAKAHKKDIIHRDIKPANIYITNDGIVKILDFGLAKVSSQTQMTMMGATMGTAAYMSPEQSRGGTVDHRTDIWALGIILYEMITAQQPFKGDYEQAVIYSIINEKPEPLTNINKEIPEKLEWIVNKAIEKNPEDRYQNIDELIDDLNKLKDGSSGIEIDRIKKIKLLQSTFFTAAILIILMIGYLSIQTDVFDNTLDSSLKWENSIAVMYFENRTDEVDLEKILIDMLTTNLARYEDLKVVGSQRLFDILNAMDEVQQTSNVNHTVATKVAKTANVKTMLLGSIIKIGNTMRITSQLTDVESGEIIASEQIKGNNIEDIFNMADELTQKVANNFSLVRGKSKVDTFKIADVSTISYDAYKYFVRGLEDSWQFKLGSSANNFRTAIEFDSTFAMAHLYWAMTEGGLKSSDPYSDLSEINRALQLAEHYSYKTTNKERLFIKAQYAAEFLFDNESALTLFEEYVRKYPDDKEAILSLGWTVHILMDIEKTEQAFNRLIELDPSFADAYLLMAYTYSRGHIDDKAISAAKKYSELQPYNWNTYATMWDIYTQAGEYQDAYRVCEEAIEKLDFNITFNSNIGILHLLEKDVSKARESFQFLIDYWLNGANPPSMFSKLLPYSYIFEGKYLTGFKELNEIYKLKLRNDNLNPALITLVDLGKLMTVTGDYSRADELFSEALGISSKLYSVSYNTSKIIIKYYSGIAQLKSGNVTEALKTVENMKKLLEGKNYKPLYINYVYLLLTDIYLFQKNLESAILEFDKVSAETKYSFPRAQKLLIEINILTGNLDLAISQCLRFYNKVTSSQHYDGGDAFDYFYEISKIPYTLGKIYELKGEPDKAVEHYEEAVNLWKDADSGMFYAEDAKIRLARLKKEL